MSGIDDYSHHKAASYYIISSIKSLFWNKSNHCITPLSSILGIWLAYYVSCAPDTIPITLKIADVVLTTQLAIFGCFMAAYTFAITYMTDDYMKLLHNISYGNSTYLAVVTSYLRTFSFAYVIGIISSFLVKIMLAVLEDCFVLFTNDTLNVVTSTVLLSLYFVYSIRLIFELKSLVHNITIVLFGKITFQIAGNSGENKDDTD